jgi:tetratricopeptide (TPR) repeat protein
MLLVSAAVIVALANPAQSNQLGTVTFPTSCSSAVQPTIERGVALLHSFQYEEAAQAFDDAARRDLSCAMCHWGKAMTLYHQLWDWPNADALQKGRREIADAQRVGAKTARERGYLAAAAAFFNAPLAAAHARRIRAYSRQMAVMHRQFPDDGEATAFYALSLVAIADEHVNDLANLRRAIELLNPLLHEQPNHPGAAHYLIHAADRPQLAPLGLEAARVYADIAPDSSHALHMPSHIFVRLGMWQETITANLRAAAAGKQAALEHRGDYTYQVHAIDYLNYAYLQLGKGSSARALLDDLNDVPTASDKEKASDRAYSAGHAAIEEHRWSDAAALPLAALDITWLRDAYWARAMGAARSGDVAAARYNLVKYRESLRESRDRDVMSVQQLEAEAWVFFAEGNVTRSIRLLRRAAEREATEGGDEVSVPAREMLADLLFELKRPREALNAYEMVLKATPNRFDALLGAARAADALNMNNVAVQHYRQLLRVAAPDADRPELETARAYVAAAR